MRVSWPGYLSYQKAKYNCNILTGRVLYQSIEDRENGNQSGDEDEEEQEERDPGVVRVEPTIVAEK